MKKNDEILKRFQFDLELGVFKSNFNILYIIDIVDDENYKDFDCSASTKTLNLMRVLKELGYKDNSIYSFINTKEVHINTSKKIFNLCRTYNNWSAGRKLVHNSYPEYLLDYTYQER